MHRRMLFVIAIAVAVVMGVVAFASAATQITYTGQGMNDVTGPTTSKCTAPDNGGIPGAPVLKPGDQYLLWVMNGSVTGPAVLHIWHGSAYVDYPMSKVGSTFKALTPFYTKAQLTGAHPAYATFASGSPNNLVVSHGCGVAKSTTATIIHKAGGHDPAPLSMPLGSSVHDSATVTTDNNVALPANSKVRFDWYAGKDCSGASVADETDPAANSVDNALPQGPLGAGDYGYIAKFISGDTTKVLDSTGVCEPLHINKGDLTLTTTIHDASHGALTEAALGSVVHDTATLSGVDANFAPTGGISFTLNGNAVANADPTETGFAASTVDSAPLAAGSYIYRASFAGDANYNPATGEDEDLKINRRQLDISTTIHGADHQDVGQGPVALGTVVHDTADVTGEVAGFPIGKISFTLNTKDVANGSPTEAGVDANTVDSDPLAAGDYTYQATVAENGNYIGATSKEESLKVNKAELTVSTKIHDAGHSTVTDGEVPLGSVLHDTATLDLSNAVAGFPTPKASDIAFTLNGAAAAQADPTEAGFDASTVDSAPLHAGSYTYTAKLDGNDNYDVKGSEDPEKVTVKQAQLTVHTTIHNASHNAITEVKAGAVVHDTASVTGGVTGFPIPAISFTFDGNGIANGAGEAGVTANSVTVDTTNLSDGVHHFSATVAGNGDYITDDSEDEQLTVHATKYFCSPGFWKNTSDANWALTGHARTDLFNTSGIVPSYYPLINPDQTLQHVLENNSDYPAAGPVGLTGANAVGAWLTSEAGFYNGGSSTDKCPLSNG